MDGTLEHGTLDRRRFLTLAGLTALATAAPRLPMSLGSGGEALASGDAIGHEGVMRLTATEAEAPGQSWDLRSEHLRDGGSGRPWPHLAGRADALVALAGGYGLDGPMGSDRVRLSIGLALERSAFHPRPARKPQPLAAS